MKNWKMEEKQKMGGGWACFFSTPVFKLSESPMLGGTGGKRNQELRLHHTQAKDRVGLQERRDKVYSLSQFKMVL